MPHTWPNANQVAYLFSYFFATLSPMDQDAARRDLQRTGERYKEARDAYESAREEVIPSIVNALRARLPQAEIVHWSGYAREHIRRIARKHGIESERGQWKGDQIREGENGGGAKSPAH
jgi:hypothetical protein